MINDDNHFKNLHKNKMIFPERQNIRVTHEYKKENPEIKKKNNELPRQNIPNIENDKPILESILDKPIE